MVVLFAGIVSCHYNMMYSTYLHAKSDVLHELVKLNHY